CARRLENYW
nr:immunoglobulin heavy chain junction region [Mus musculus]